MTPPILPPRRVLLLPALRHHLSNPQLHRAALVLAYHNCGARTSTLCVLSANKVVTIDFRLYYEYRRHDFHSSAISLHTRRIFDYPRVCAGKLEGAFAVVQKMQQQGLGYQVDLKDFPNFINKN